MTDARTNLDAQQSEQVASLARLLIEALSAVQSGAEQHLRSRSGRPSESDALAVPSNLMVGSPQVEHRLEKIRQQVRDDLIRLRHEPFVVAVLVEDDSGLRERFYFTRAGVPPGNIPGLQGRLANYHAPMGRLAELTPGNSIKLPSATGGRITIIERVRLIPINTPDGWDGRDDRVEVSELIVTLDSLREFLAQFEAVQGPAADLLGELLAEVESAKAVFEGIRRRVIDRMTLRDQPTLDRYQGEVFRLPLDRRLLLTGPPGTGKTTTLIRRLAQKRNIDALLDAERALIPTEQVVEFFHPDNWIMFTPTDLLKLYLKEAFAKEGIAASDDRVRTWADERRHLARDVLRVLRSEQGGRFTLDDSICTLSNMTSVGLAGLSDAFHVFVQQHVVGQYESVLEELSKTSDAALAEVVMRVWRQMGEDTVSFDRIFDVVEFHEELREHVSRLSANVDQLQRTAINGVLARERDFLDRLADFLETIQEGTEEEEDEDEEDEAEDDRAEIIRDRRLLAVQAFRRTIFAHAISLHEARKLREGSRRRKILEWLADRAPNEDTLRPLGATLVTLRRVRFLAGTYRNLVDRIPAHYARFRRAAVREGNWYLADAVATVGRGRISGAEVDVILLLMLRHVRRFLSNVGGRHLRNDTRIAVLENVKQRYVTQILVDEATDFSPIQLACMLELAHPTFRSFFACGDVRQRVTTWGVRDLGELRRISSDFEIQEIDIGYRQSRQLIELAIAVAQIGGGEPLRVRIPDNVEETEVHPVLGEHLKDEMLARWLAERIREIERALKAVPSIAIFVDTDERIERLVTQLRAALAEYNLDVVGCPSGRVVGGESQIRVFDVQYIKGLEFEAVFFVDVDLLLARYGDLFDKFFYVGVTRAATYLGITCEENLPTALNPLRSHFTAGGWAQQ